MIEREELTIRVHAKYARARACVRASVFVQNIKTK